MITVQQETLNTALGAVDWESKFGEYLADLRAGIDALKNAAPQNEEERHDVFLLKKQIVDTLLERATINKNREVKIEIRVNLLAILKQDAESENSNSGAYSRRGGIYIHIPDLYPAGQILVVL